MITQKEMLLDYIKTRKFAAKIASLVLAIMLWSFIGNQHEREIYHRIEVEIKNLPDDQLVTNMELQYVGVRLRGESRDLELIDRRDITAFIDLERGVLGRPYLYDLGLEYEGVPENIDVSLEKRRMFVTVAKKLSKSVFVLPKHRGRVPSGYFLGTIEMVPPEVFVYGSVEMIQRIDNIETMEFSVSGMASTTTIDVALDLRRVDYSEISTDTVTARVQIIPADSVRFYDVPLKVNGIMEDYTYTVNQSLCRVYLEIGTEGISEINEDDIRVWIDVPLVNESDFITDDGRQLTHIKRHVPVQSRLESGIRSPGIYSVVPDSVIVGIQR